MITSLGLFILDSFEFIASDEVSSDAISTTIRRNEVMLGGGGLYAILGARMWLSSCELGLLIDRGNDWDANGRSTQIALDQFGKDMWRYRERIANRGTTKALNRYRGEVREFEYLEERTPLEYVDLPPELRASSLIHVVCSPARCSTIISQLPTSTPYSGTSATASADITTSAASSSSHSQASSSHPVIPQIFPVPRIVFEPIPTSCSQENLPDLRQILPYLYVFSPNHEEAAAFFTAQSSSLETDSSSTLPSSSSSSSCLNSTSRSCIRIQSCALRFIEEGCRGWIVIRSGSLGCYFIRAGMAEGRWIEAYHKSSERVVDVTGAGNSFLGGLMAGLAGYDGADECSDAEVDRMMRACRMGSVSASFVIEQYGLPRFESRLNGTKLLEERWNGSLPVDRLAEMELSGA